MAALLGGPLGAASGQTGATPQSKGYALTILDDLGEAQGASGDTSVTIGADGLGLISYYDAANGDLKVAHCRNVVCRAATTTVVDDEGDVGRWSSIAIGADGLGVVSYYDASNGDLKVAHCQNAACSAASTATIDAEGGPSSITLGVDGRGLIGYEGGGALRVAHCSNTACSAAATSLLDVVEGSPHPSITIGADGLGLIAYSNRAEDNPRLNVAHCSDVACSAAAIATPWPCFCERVLSITLGSDGLGLISAVDIDSNLEVVHCSNLECSAATGSFVGSFFRAASITTGADGFGLAAAVKGDAQGLHVAHCEAAGCASVTTSQVDPSISVVGLTSITVGADGLPLISYYDHSDLKVAHCSQASCLPRR